MAKALPITNSDDSSILISCPACGHGHVLNNRWHWNGDQEKPTFGPAYPGSAHSLLVTLDMGPHLSENDIKHGIKEGHNICHNYITDGMIQFLPDCTHLIPTLTDLAQW